jgi:HK97 family phage portal protein
MQIVPDKTNPIAVGGYIFTQPDGARIPFSPKEILHFKNFNPTGYHPFPHRGMGIVEAAAWAINTDNEARAFNYAFFKNSAKPDGILTTAGDGAMDTDELMRIRAEWDASYQGSANASKVAILGGGLTWTEISRSQKDMDFVNQRTFSRDEILALFRTPKSIIGITDDVNRANADAAIYVFALRTIKPLMQSLADHLTEMLSAGIRRMIWSWISSRQSWRIGRKASTSTLRASPAGGSR